MIQKIRNSRTFKLTSITLVINILVEIISPMQAWALTGGPAQPEFNSFTPIGATDMVDLSSGDMSYNIPLMDVGGYPLNIAYNSAVGMDEEASWVGLGWNLSVGQINRNVRGIPDDFSGDQLTYEDYLKTNVTVGASFKLNPSLFGAGIFEEAVSVGLTANYNNYSGFSLRPSAGMNFSLSKNVSVGFNLESTEDGLNVSPSLSLHHATKVTDGRNTKIAGNVGLSMNSRSGISRLTMDVSRTNQIYDATKNRMKADRTKQAGSLGSSIGFAEQVYTPSKRVGMTTGSFTVNAALGSEFFGGEGQGQITAYGTVMKVKENTRNIPAYGYSRHQSGKNAIQDINREKDGPFSVNSTNLAIVNHTYDVYSVQGQGVSGMYRPYQAYVGHVNDATIYDNSTSGSLGVEIGFGNAVHAGADFEVTSVSSHSGKWASRNNIAPKLKFKETNDPTQEEVYYKNVGDLSVDSDFGMFDQVGRYQPIRAKIVGAEFYRSLTNKYLKKESASIESDLSVTGIQRTNRKTRNQAIMNFTIKDINDGKVRGWNGHVLTSGYSGPSSSKDHHVGEVQIIRNDGARYVYGLPAYNNTKKEATFAVKAEDGNCVTGLVSYTPSKLSNPSSLPNNKYLNRITTPGYVHSHLLTSVLSTDYQDLTNDGPTLDDLGSYTKFSYERTNPNYKWRVPFQQNMATHNSGLNTESEDDQGSYVYGEKEQYIIKKIETKTHVAIFDYSQRKDAKGVDGEHGGLGASNHSYKLDKISLYTITDYEQSTNPTPIKTVNFVYDYALCKNVPNNDGTSVDPSGNEMANQGGKLTLQKIYFTYQNSKMGKYTGYEFDYDEITPSSNPDYNIKGYDTWGNYMTPSTTCSNTDNTTTSEFPYTSQDASEQNTRASVWTLKKIALPSGGEIIIDYESDNYSHIQNRSVLEMYKIAGAGANSDGSVQMESNTHPEWSSLFDPTPLPNHKKFLYIEIDPNEALTTEWQLEQKYIPDVNKPIAFRFFLNMTQKGGMPNNDNEAHFDYVSGYFEYDKASTLSVFTTSSGTKYLSLPVVLVDKESNIPSFNVNPIAKAGWHFGRNYLSPHVYGMMPNGDNSTIEHIVNDMLSNNILNNLIEIFTGPNSTLEKKNIARRFMTQKSWIRLKHSTGEKFGGGSRVKEIQISDKWSEMAGVSYESMQYGQTYSYELENGKTSGVATYEPIGNKENPFVQPIFSTTKHLLAPDETNYVEEPFGESFFPNPQVTYSRVSVRNRVAGSAPSGLVIKQKHRTGSVVTEFYTSKDYPTIVDQTKLDVEDDKNELLGNLLKLKVRNHVTASQGFVVHLNDMNGKQKAQWVYAEGQDQPISGIEYIYDKYTSEGELATNTNENNKGILNNEVKVIYSDGSISKKTIGVEIDVFNDFRENSTFSQTQGINTNVAGFLALFFPVIVPVLLPDVSTSEDQFRSVSTTKVINTFGILKETKAYDAGSMVTTRNLAWDAVTGEVLVTETVDEFNDKYYTFNYPAHWYYKGMGQASKNLGLDGILTNLGGGYYNIANAGFYAASDFMIPGDELYVGSGGSSQKLWVSHVSGNQFKLIDAGGNTVTNASGYFKIFRSGFRNLQSAGIMNVTLMKNPLMDGSAEVTNIGSSFLIANNDYSKWKIINAGAVDYSDYWKVSCECGVDVSGNYNPYLLNERGVWRTKSSRTFLTGRNANTAPTPRNEGFFIDFRPMYILRAANVWHKNMNEWTFVAEVSKYSPYGFEHENVDALNRYSAAQYGYNHSLPMSVGANTQYREIGFDGFEDYDYSGCPTNQHFSFQGVIAPNAEKSNRSHSGKRSLKVNENSNVVLTKTLDCPSQ